MKIVFVSNYFNHHQKPFCEALYRKIGDDFAFVSTSVMREERRKLGYADGDVPDYVLLAYANDEQRSQAMELINEADVVIAGSAPNDMLLPRIREGKLLLRYSERPYKVKPSFLKKIYHFFRLHQNDLWRKNVYMLCSGAYTARDYASIGLYRSRAFRWGYFPELKRYEIDKLLAEKQRKTILWCGRFLPLKHPDDVIIIAKRLKEEGYRFSLQMIGLGEMEEELKRLVLEYDLADSVSFLGSMPPEQVRRHMEQAGIYLFTSDSREGWGAVLNESMNSGCAVVASHAIGAVPCLIKGNENGLIYESGNVDMLCDKVRMLLDRPDEQARIGKAAYETICDEWNAETAAERFVCLSERLLSEEKAPELYESGPCSRAEVVFEEQIRTELQ